MPLIQRILSGTGTTLAVWHITESAAELSAMLEHPEYHAPLTSSLKPESRRLREVLAVRCLLKELCGVERIVAYTSFGAPYLLDKEFGSSPSEHEAIAISHTENYAVLMYSYASARPIGVDIERLGTKVPRVVSRFLSDTEQSFLTDLLHMHLAWSAKEADYKVLGRDYYDLRSTTQIETLDTDRHLITLRLVYCSAPMQLSYIVSDDYVLVWTL